MSEKVNSQKNPQDAAPKKAPLPRLWTQCAVFPAPDRAVAGFESASAKQPKIVIVDSRIRRLISDGDLLNAKNQPKPAAKK